jgi:(1->4)-alpha-D-glucan 1-alpha-D-glucosylmutase
MGNDAEVHKLAAAAGLASEYQEIGGAIRAVAPESLRAILAALGYDDSNPAEALAALEAGRAKELVAAVAASFVPDSPAVAINSAALADGDIRWTLTGEGRDLSGTSSAGELEAREGQRWLGFPALEPGYYTLRIAVGHKRAETLFVRAPARAWLPSEPTRGYGLSLQLYEQIGPQSVGIGDFTDLADLGAAAGKMGAATVGINPLHALFLSAPERASPYSPSSRLALNPLYLDIRRLPGLDERLRARLASPTFAAHAKALNAQAWVDYPAVAKTKLAIAREAFANFRAAGGDPAFTGFCKRASAGTIGWAQFETIAAAFAGDTRAWPAELHARKAKALEAFLVERRSTFDFYLWLQWQAETQLSAAAQQAKKHGLSIGLYHDLALGADPAGAEVWAGGADYARELAVGAPPDPLNPSGQNWGFPPLAPSRLLARRLAPFIEVLRANMRHAGALRIDHVLGLNRLFVIPQGGSPGEGAYLRYPLELLLAVIALESHRARCLVVGEDLGTVPEGLRAKLAKRGILSLRLLYFERGETGRPRSPESYPELALAAVATHDLPPLAGWWDGSDLARTDRLALWPSEANQAAAHAARPNEKAALRAAFRGADLPEAQAEPPAVAAYRWLARAPSRLLAIQPEDALEISEPVNVPGTLDEAPNWRCRRLPPWPEWLADPRFLQVLRAVQAERNGPAAREPSAPTATYRLQLHKNFGFRDAAARLRYLARLGISHLYLSPIMRAVPGSTHGYDMSDPARLDEERGGEAGFAELLSAARAGNLGMIADFVPNHMGADASNPWWMDLLEWGHASVHDASFDVDWSAEEGRLILPILGAPPQEVLARGEIEIRCEPSGRFCAAYFTRRLPLAPASTAGILRLAARRVNNRKLAELAQRMHTLGKLSDDSRRAAGLALQGELADLAEDEYVAGALAEAAGAYACDAKHVGRLLARQHWRLMYWRRGLEELNYRRFFDIGDLAALRMERPAVFAAAHAGIRKLIADCAIQGLRLDHVDGLSAPGHYLDSLAALVAAQGGSFPLWVEKILGVDEKLCAWPVAGTTGYEFLNDVTRVFIADEDAERLRDGWRKINPDAKPFTQILTRVKREAVENLFGAMLDRIVVALAERAPLAPERLRDALVEFAVAFPVYRAYPDAPARTRVAQEALVAHALATVTDDAAREWLGEVFALPTGEAARLPAPLRDGVARFWQLASAAMAKGLEDTAFYRDFALLALNEVGGDPRVPSLSPNAFHARMARRARDWPAALSASATHDTKRGEDARMRLAMLAAHSKRWAAIVPELRRATSAPRPRELHSADEYLVWQTLLAIWPPPVTRLDASARESLAARLEQYLIKALREGKQRSSWLEPNAVYEKGIADYAAALLDSARAGDFQRLFLPFAAALAKSGALASLAALTLKCIAPGIPDIYQGTELWDLTLVDPDNRRPVDYTLRERLLAELESQVADCGDARLSLIEDLLDAWPDGRIKLYMLAELLALRRKRPASFAGGYRPLKVVGAHADDALAFARGSPGREIWVLTARVAPALEAKETVGLAAETWGDTRILAEDRSRRWREALTGRRFEGDTLRVGDFLAPLPAAILIPD